MSETLAQKLSQFVDEHNIHPDPYFVPYKSGVYAVIDCVFSAQANYTTVTKATKRLAERLPDTADLTFSQFLADLEQFGPDHYADKVLTRQVLAKRPKVQVACDVAQFFVARNIETKADLHARYPVAAVNRLGKEAQSLENLFLNELVSSIRGIGPVLASYLLVLMEYENYVKSDTLLTRLMNSLSITPLMADHAEHRQEILEAIRTVAKEKETTAYRLDNALWKFESGGRKPLVWNKPE